MSQKKVRRQPLSPQQVSSAVWYYEEGRHITVVLDGKEWSERIASGCYQFRIPARMLEATVSRFPKTRKAKS